MKFLSFIILFILAVSFLLTGAVAQAATSATVTSTVTIQSVSVSVSSGTVSYGTLATSATKDTTATGLNDTQTVTNNGNVAEDFAIAGTNSTNWTLAATAGSDQYTHKFSTNSGSTWTALTTSNATLASNIAANGTQNFDLQINTPTSSSVTTQQSVNVTILATAH